jgi:hypothetical protein
MNERRRKVQPRGLVAGLVMITVGLIFLADQLDWLDTDLTWRYWPLILVALGLGRLGWAEGREQVKSALVLLLMGSWLMVNTLELFELDWRSSWPLLLIGFGLIWTWEALSGARERAATPVEAGEERHD